MHLICMFKWHASPSDIGYNSAVYIMCAWRGSIKLDNAPSGCIIVSQMQLL